MINGKMGTPANKPGWAAAKGQAMAEVSKAMPNKAMPAPVDKPAGTNDMMMGMMGKMDEMMAMMQGMMAGQGPKPGM